MLVQYRICDRCGNKIQEDNFKAVHVPQHGTSRYELCGYCYKMVVELLDEKKEKREK